MLGHGRTYQDYRTGQIEADEEVAMIHGPAVTGYPVIHDALVNLRANAGLRRPAAPQVAPTPGLKRVGSLIPVPVHWETGS